MSIAFSDSVNNTGIVQQSRKFVRLDSSQWPTVNIVNSANNWKDFVTGYAIGADTRFRWDNTNHSKLPEGTTDLVLNQADYSFQTDEQSNNILTLTGLSLVDANGRETALTPVDRNDPNYDISTFGKTAGVPTQYDKISDNIVRLDFKASSTAVSTYDLKFYFVRTSPYWDASDTTETTGFAPILDRGFVIACAYDAALTLGLPNLQGLAVERQREEERVVSYFANRNEDEVSRMIPEPIVYE